MTPVLEACLTAGSETRKHRNRNMPIDMRSVKVDTSGQFITTSAEVTPNGGLVRESPPKWP